MTDDGRHLLDLAERRAKIEEIDRRIIALLADRVALGRETAEIKRAAGLPILDPQREAEVIRRAVTTAREHDLPVESVRELFWQVVGLSRRAQEDAP
ncbi:MAG: chorismate mutase [Gemmatimonadota bacterium]